MAVGLFTLPPSTNLSELALTPFTQWAAVTTLRGAITVPVQCVLPKRVSAPTAGNAEVD